LNSYEQYIFNSRYARWLDEEGRRETWEETVNRYLDFFESRNPKIVKPIRKELFDAIHNLDVVPSMRAVMSAGKALERDNVAGYNCAYLACDNLRAWDEAAYILMCGTGVGYSVERQYVTQLPEIAEKMFDTDTVITVSDSKIGWAKAIRETVAMAYAGQIPQWDFSRIRPAGKWASSVRADVEKHCRHHQGCGRSKIIFDRGVRCVCPHCFKYRSRRSQA